MSQSLTEQIYETVSYEAELHHASRNEKTKAVLNQTVAELSVAAAIVHQVHWYMRGPGFFHLHPKMDELMDDLNARLDEVSERLITIGGNPFSTLTEFRQHAKLEEKPGSFQLSMSDHLSRLVDVYAYLVALYQVGLEVSDAEGDAPTNDIYTAAQAEAEKTIWMLQAELGQAPGIR